MAGQAVELAVVGGAGDPPEAGGAEVGQARTELVAQQPEQPEDLVAVAGGVGHELATGPWAALVHAVSTSTPARAASRRRVASSALAHDPVALLPRPRLLPGGRRLHHLPRRPTAEQTALALHQAVRREADPAWPVLGLLDVLYSEHGSDFTSARPKRVSLANPHPADPLPRRSPAGPRHDRAFYGTTTELLPHLPGHTSRTAPTESRPRRPRSSFDQLDAVLERFVVEQYHRRPQGGRAGGRS